MRRDLLGYLLTLDVLEVERAEKLDGEVASGAVESNAWTERMRYPQFETISITDIVLIDFGFWGAAPVGFDLQTLLVGDVQIGRRPASTLGEMDEAIIPAYVEGLRAEGCDIPEAVVRRGHAIRSLLMTGLSTVPVDLFERPITDELQRVADDRALIARYCLDRLDATS